MTEPLPTLADIDSDQARAHHTKARVLEAVALNDQENLEFLADLVTLDETVDALLELRAATSRLGTHA